MRCGAEAEGGGTSDVAMAAILSYSGGSACVDDERADVAHYSTPLDSKSVVFQRRRSADIPTGSGLPYMEMIHFI